MVAVKGTTVHCCPNRNDLLQQDIQPIIECHDIGLDCHDVAASIQATHTRADRHFRISE